MGGSITLIVVAVAIVAGATGLWIYRRRSAAPKLASADSAAPKKQAEQWGVRIATNAKERACPQVRKLLGREFPLAKKPPLPVKNCPFAQHCECHYVKLFDRRQAERRSGRERRRQQRFEDGHKDRRSGQDRRGKRIDWV
ncbi:MAG TPA: hypothetical protein VMN79_13385 [Casimicrobiaceae bacterium]|nr:hypothetical protein [Casimicrobiaceae bacterium]